MKKYKNEGVIDRGVRLLISELLILVGYFWVGGLLAIILYVLGVIALITAITGFCGLYKAMGVNTLSKEGNVSPVKTGLKANLLIEDSVIINNKFVPKISWPNYPFDCRASTDTFSFASIVHANFILF